MNGPHESNEFIPCFEKTRFESRIALQLVCEIQLGKSKVAGFISNNPAGKLGKERIWMGFDQDVIKMAG